MGRELAYTVVVDEVEYVAGTVVEDDIAAKIGNPKAFADVVEDTTEADAAAGLRAREAFDAGRPIRELTEEELRAWAYDPDLETEAGQDAEARLMELEGGGQTSPETPTQTEPPAPESVVTDPEGGKEDENPEDVKSPEDSTPEPPREGRGSGVTAWRTYAEGKGLEVPADADRDAIVAIVDAAKQ